MGSEMVIFGGRERNSLRKIRRKRKYNLFGYPTSFRDVNEIRMMVSICDKCGYLTLFLYVENICMERECKAYDMKYIFIVCCLFVLFIFFIFSSQPRLYFRSAFI